eukprot:5211960-Pleurochrysis_carterae.AAC.1
MICRLRDSGKFWLSCFQQSSLRGVLGYDGSVCEEQFAVWQHLCDVSPVLCQPLRPLVSVPLLHPIWPAREAPIDTGTDTDADADADEGTDTYTLVSRFVVLRGGFVYLSLLTHARHVSVCAEKRKLSDSTLI